MKTHNLFWKWFRTDNRKNRFSATAMVLFGGASVMLFVLTVALFVNLLGAVTYLMERAQVPDYLQMHAGELQESAVAAFAEEEEQVTQWQISRFLNLDNSGIYLGEHCLLDSTQDNGLAVQNPFFDLLLEQANVVTTPGAGFGPSGEGYIRMTAFGDADQTVEAVARVAALLKK